MVNKKRLDGRWIQLYTSRIKMLPILGRYNISQADRWQQVGNLPDFREVDHQPRDIFTKRVGSSAVGLSDVADIDFLRRKGHCLATEDEILHSQRYSRVQKSIISKYQRDPVRLPRIASTATASSTTNSDFVRWSQRSIMVFDHRRRSSVLKQLESHKRHVAQKHLEHKIMKSREYYYKNRTRESVPNIDGVIRKYVAEALDDRHREMLSVLELPSEETTDKETRLSLFQDWKKSAIDILDKQAEEDLKMVAAYKKIIRRPTVVKQKRGQLHPAPMTQVDEDTRGSVVASGISWDDNDSVRTLSVIDPLEHNELEQRKDSDNKVVSRSRELSPASLVFKLSRHHSDSRTPSVGD